MKKYKLVLSIILLVFFVLSILGYNYYALIENQSNHTGVGLYNIKIFYLIISIIPFILAYFFRKDKKSRNILIISGILGLLLVFNIWLFEKICIMQNYENWIHNRMC